MGAVVRHYAVRLSSLIGISSGGSKRKATPCRISKLVCRRRPATREGSPAVAVGVLVPLRPLCLHSCIRSTNIGGGMRVGLNDPREPLPQRLLLLP